MKWFALLLIGLPLVSYAGLESDLEGFFDKVGMSANITSAESYHGQQAGYYTGGSVFARNRVRQTQIASLTLPRVRAGCGGIDLFAGGFSFVSSQELVNTMRNIVSNATSYAFMLALKSMTPEISNVMEYAEGLANDVNRMTINSCETGAALTGALWPKTQVAQKNVCATIGAESGKFRDWAAAKQACNSGGEEASIMKNAQDNPVFEAMQLGNTNLMWKALRKNELLADDPELAQLFMSLSGTLILKKIKDKKFPEDDNDDNKPQILQVLPSLANDSALIKALLYGDTAEIYHCDEEEKCLSPSIKNITIVKNKALAKRVGKLLESMVTKVYTDEALTSEEKGLLNSTSLPVYKMLNVQAAFGHHKTALDVTLYTEVIAFDIVLQYLQESLNLAELQLSTRAYPEAWTEKLRDGIHQALQQLHQLQGGTFQRFSLNQQLISQTQLLEQMLSGELSSDFSQTLQWTKEIS